MSETCPASQGRGERYTVRTDETRTDETEGLTGRGLLFDLPNRSPASTIPQSALRLTAPFTQGSQRAQPSQLYKIKIRACRI